MNFKKLALAALLVATSAVMASADDYTGPAITRYYPAKADTPQTLKDSGKAYVYFTTGSKILWAKALVTQNGETLGTCIYKKGSSESNTATMTPTDPDNEVMASIVPGEFTITFYGVCWRNAEGEEESWEDISANIGDVTYLRPFISGEITGTSGMEINTLLSYYPADSEDGVFTITFSKPITIGGPSVQLVYGYTETYYTPIEYTQSADGLNLTIDFRGACHNADVLAPGAIFVDIDGTILPNPETISLQITGLLCQDGSSVNFPTHGTTLTNQAYYGWAYNDITLPTPVLVKAEFYASTDPSSKFLNMSTDTDMMELTLENAASLKSADVKFVNGELTATVANADIDKADDVYTMEIPAVIREIGSSGLTIELVNFEMQYEDGAPHVVEPLTFESVSGEVFTIAEIKELAEMEAAVLVTSDLLITYSDESILFCFGEDSTGALEFRLETEQVPFEFAKKVSGRIAGVYNGSNLFIVDLANSQISTEDADVTYGKLVYTIADLAQPENACHLVSLVLNENMSSSVQDDGTLILTETDGEEQTGFVMVPTDHLEGFVWPTGELLSITGISYDMWGTPVLLIRNQNDLDVDNSHSGVSEIVADSANSSVIFNMQGIRVAKISAPGLYIIDGKKVIVK